MENGINKRTCCDRLYSFECSWLLAAFQIFNLFYTVFVGIIMLAEASA